MLLFRLALYFEKETGICGDILKDVTGTINDNYINYNFKIRVFSELEILKYL